MSLWRKWVRQSVDATLKFVGGRSEVVCGFLEKIHPTYTVREGKGPNFVFATPNRLTLWRAKTLFTKEPETIDWIDSFGDEDVFYDVGANIGVYTIYAGVRKKGLTIFAFEPAFFNYGILNTNILLNGLETRVSALNIALDEKDALDFLFCPSVDAGGALTNVGEALDYKKDRFQPRFKQAVVAFSLDSFIEKYRPPFPNHIKLDVDGLEARILRGAMKTLGDSRLKSVSVELNDALPEDVRLTEVFESCGLHFKHKKHAALFDGTPYKDIFNVVFARDRP